jgi:S1-C subfamily serine protease
MPATEEPDQMSRARAIRHALTGRSARTAAVALVAAAIGGGIVAATDGGGGSSSAPVATAPTATATDSTATASTTAASLVSGGLTATDFSGIYARRRAGIVSITSTVPSSATVPGTPGDSTATGSGVVIDTDGHILTNDHVIAGATKVRVEFSSGRTVTAKLVGTDPSTDVAVLDVDVPASQLSPVPLGDSSKLRVGDPVMAIGDPFGYDGSASAGIVSGLDRSIEAPNGFTITGAIQTDAAVNHGNSGGALLDAKGELIGIPDQIADSGVNANVGVAFAVPSDTAKRIIAGLEANGKVEHAWLGVTTASVDATVGSLPGVGASKGALITGVVNGGPADKAGIAGGTRAANDEGSPICVGGDVVTALGSTRITSASDLQNAVDAQKPGATVSLTVVSPGGQSRSVDVTLGSRPNQADSQARTTSTCGR